jgi:colanic acid/amylovoran biosynthesis glycosyltransferase
MTSSPARAPEDHRPRVVAWRDYWLAPSETFIRDQVTELRTWEAICVGRRQFARALVVPHFAPHSDAPAGRLASRLPASRRTRAGYDRLLADPAVRLVHAHFGQDALTALPYAARAGKPLVVSFYGMDVTALPYRRSPAGLRYRQRLPELFDRAHTLIAPSEFLAGELELLGAPRHKMRFIPPGTAVGPRPLPDARRSGIIFVGRLVEKKGAADLLTAVALLPAALRSVPVTIVGYGPLLPGLTRTAQRLGLNVTFAGQQTSAQVQHLLRRHAIFCGPSKRAADGDSESLGMVFIEAALAGLPVASYRHGGVRESVGDGATGLLARESDTAGLAANLRSLLEDPDRATAMGAAGYDRAAALFNLATQTVKLEHMYDSVTEQARI